LHNFILEASLFKHLTTHVALKSGPRLQACMASEPISFLPHH
jgi:hypothetical protein